MYFGRDLDVAVMKFRQWQQMQGKRPAYAAVKVPMPLPMPLPSNILPDPNDQIARLNAGESPDDVFSTAGTYSVVPEDALFAWFREQLLTRPAYVAERTGIEQLGYLQELAKPSPSLTLKQVEHIYFGRKRKLSATRERDQRRYWKEFTLVVAVRSIREITAEHIEEFHDHVWSEAEEQGWSASSVKHRLDCPRTFFRAALRKGRGVEQLRRVIDLTAMFEMPQKSDPDPRPLSRDEVDRLLEAATKKWKAVILLSLNGALYPDEVAVIRKKEVDLSNRTYVGRRPKTGVLRTAVLWPRTVTAIRDYLAEEPHDGDTLFVSAIGQAYSANHVGRNFRRLRRAAKLGDDVNFACIRDSAYTRAVEGGVGVDQAKLVAGHSVPGISDAYIKRNPQMVADACLAIERYYFGDAD